jgi:hypothetical protein
MSRCKKCGSFAINPSAHGRADGVDLDLCDVCYWRTRYDKLAAAEQLDDLAQAEIHEDDTGRDEGEQQ